MKTDGLTSDNVSNVTVLKELHSLTPIGIARCAFWCYRIMFVR